MFSKILIANRGEIACRIMATARRMGIATVAVHSDVDREAAHVRMADEAVEIGGAAAAESYLDIARIVAAARETGAEAVHPGFGFLAENADFVAALDAAGIVFIGPSAEAIAAMGDKLESKRLAARAGVATIPGHDGEVADPEAAVEIARAIGYPVMIKASAGGGGKGMRIAHDDEAVVEGLRAAASEARAAFGDDRLLIEKFIEEPRHIEIQVLADGQGGIVHLGERECSIQRRHQKIIEEAPSPLVDPDMRARMGEQAVALARAVDYRSAGTVEFVVDRNKNFYFLEMNTRLQVEHPVTELITGIDLVEQMIRIAAGEPLAFGQDDIAIDGWAIEGRVYAEDPARGFLPSIGRLRRYRPPEDMEGLRIDAGVFEGAEITVHYDPMIAKVCAHGADRDEAVARLGQALDAFEIKGVETNIPFLAAVMRHPRFVEGRLTTGFVAEEYGAAFEGAPVEGTVAETLIAVALLVHLGEMARANAIPGQIPGYAWQPGKEWVVMLGERSETVEAQLAGGGVDVTLGGRRLRLRGAWQPGETRFSGRLDERQVTVLIERRRTRWRLRHAGATVDVAVLRPREAELAALMPAKVAPDRSRQLLSPMPGRVVSILVEPDQEVKAGDALCVVDAMKMENVLRAERDGRVARIAASPGDSVSADQLILEFA